MFKAVSDVILTESTGQRISTAVAVLLLVAATVLARPDRNPIAWLLTRPDRWALLRLVGVLGGLPLLVGVSRLPFLALGLGTEAAWILATTIATLIAGVAVFYLSQREQGLLIDKELLSRQRAEAEMRYRILADNAVDVVFHLHGNTVTWVSPSVAAAFGEPPPQWIGSDLSLRIHPDDLEAVATAVRGIGPDRPVLARFRVRAADGGYHWVDGNAKPYIDADGNPDGLIAALRMVDDQVEAQQRLDRLARFDTLTGLPNRAEVIGRLESALQQPRSPGSDLGILFCDVDHFKTINDTLGHAAGDVVLATLAARISESIRQGDTVGRIGGDEMVVLLPGVHSVDEAARIAEKIRCRAAEPIHHDGRTIQATLSIGATVSVRGESATAVTARADEAMYQAKQARRNTVVRI
jgi:diguanylate cyclase (GGDEF)-like protein/PAS domain S-box-containing protein